MKIHFYNLNPCKTGQVRKGAIYSLLKTFIISLAIVAISSAIMVVIKQNVFAQIEINEINLTNSFLDNSVDSILDEKLTTEYYYNDKMELERTELVQEYYYISKQIVDEKVIFSDYAPFSNKIEISNQKKRIYSGLPFYKHTDNFVYLIEYATSTIEKYQTDILSKKETYPSWKKLFFQEVLAQTSEYAGSGDGGIERLYTAGCAANWACVQAGTVGTHHCPTGTMLGCNYGLGIGKGGGNWDLSRATIPFLLTDIASSTSASVSLWINSKVNDVNSGLDTLLLTISTPAVSTTTALEDFDLIGNVGAPVPIVTPIDFSDISTGQYTEFVITDLNSLTYNGYTNIGVRIGEDITAEPTYATNNQNRLVIHSSDYANIDHDPFIEITEPVEIPVVDDPLEMIYYDDISIITTFTEQTNASGTIIGYESTTYHSPFLQFIFIVIIIVFCLWIIYYFAYIFKNEKKKK